MRFVQGRAGCVNTRTIFVTCLSHGPVGTAVCDSPGRKRTTKASDSADSAPGRNMTRRVGFARNERLPRRTAESAPAAASSIGNNLGGNCVQTSAICAVGATRIRRSLNAEDDRVKLPGPRLRSTCFCMAVGWAAIGAVEGRELPVDIETRAVEEQLSLTDGALQECAEELRCRQRCTEFQELKDQEADFAIRAAMLAALNSEYERAKAYLVLAGQAATQRFGETATDKQAALQWYLDSLPGRAETLPLSPGRSGPTEARRGWRRRLWQDFGCSAWTMHCDRIGNRAIER